MKYLPEILTTAAALIGWLLLTLTLSELVSVWAWAVSGGLLLLSLCGWRLLFVVARDGLYSLTRDDGDE